MTGTESYLFRDAQDERIHAAEECLDSGTRRVIADLPFDRDGTVLEVGAGGGSVARWIREIQGPNGRVLATDIDVSALGRAENPPGLSIMTHDIVKDPLDESYDLIHARLLLEHLPEREAVLNKLASALRPGGWLVIEDMDYASAVPVSELGRELHARIQSVRLAEFAANGVDQYYGRRLPNSLRAAGLQRVDHDGRASLMEGGSASARWLKLSLLHLRGRLVATGKLSEGDLDQMIELLDNPAFAAFEPIMIAAWGQRP